MNRAKSTSDRQTGLTTQPDGNEAVLHVRRDNGFAVAAGIDVQPIIIRAAGDEWTACFIQQTDDVDRRDAG
jgi:hypothetical protein